MLRKTIAITALLVAVTAICMIPPAARAGEDRPIRTVSVSGHRLEYRLIDMKEKARRNGVRVTPQMKSHHLMLFVVEEKSGRKVADGRAGYLVTTPDGRVQKVMAMKMNQGYGGDVDLAPGENRIKVKFVANGVRIVDGFTIRL